MRATKFFENPAKFTHFGNDINKSKLYPQGNQKQIKFGKCMPPFSSKCFAFLSLSKKTQRLKY
jgi:hypothetical protein